MDGTLAPLLHELAIKYHTKAFVKNDHSKQMIKATVETITNGAIGDHTSTVINHGKKNPYFFPELLP